MAKCDKCKLENGRRQEYVRGGESSGMYCSSCYEKESSDAYQSLAATIMQFDNRPQCERCPYRAYYRVRVNGTEYNMCGECGKLAAEKEAALFIDQI